MRAKRVAVAVSGGSDSLALLLLLQALSDAELVALSVNHGLRREAGEEIAYVAKICVERGIAHETLNVETCSAGNLQANARQSRYQAMNAYCVTHDISLLAIGHTRNDQIETFLMAAFRGSGVDGLAAMPTRLEGHPLILRPALGLTRLELQDYLRQTGVEWVEDPSNDNDEFDRVRLRKWLADAPKFGINSERVDRTIANMQRVRDFLENETLQASKALLQFSPFNVEAQIDRARILALHPEIALRLLSQACQYYGGSSYKPRLASLEKLLAAIEKPRGGMVLQKTEFSWSERRLRIYAESAYLPPPAIEKWHNYQCVNRSEIGSKIGALGAAAQNENEWREWGICARAAQSLPAFFHADHRVLANKTQIKTRSFWNLEEFD